MLPRPLNKLIGREQELQNLHRLLSTTPLLTLTGAGGCGKTRLALEVGRQFSSAGAFPHGVFWVELADLTDPLLLPQSITSAFGIEEQPGWSFTDFLQQKELLLILDNCEHLVAACAHLVEHLLGTCPRLRILATSREALNIPGELVWPVPSLSLPLTTPQLLPFDELKQYGAVQLFLERAATTSPSFQLTPENAGTVLQICRRLDGIPLATELAAARVNVLSLEQIVARLDDSYRLLTGGRRTALPRQQTLRATMDWSYSLLSTPERLLFRRLTIFAGGFILEAAEAVCSDRPVKSNDGLEEADILEILSYLVAKSLVIVEKQESEEVRYRLLETIRQYSHERLWEAGEAALLQERHWNYYIGLIESAGMEILGPQQVVWFDLFEREYDNLRVAFGRLLERGDVSLLARIAGGVFWHFWFYRGYRTEGRHLLERILVQYTEPDLTRAWCLLNAGLTALYQEDAVPARYWLEEGLILSRAVGDRRLTAYFLRSLGYLRQTRGDYEEAIKLYEECLPLLRELNDKVVLELVLSNFGLILLVQGEYGRGRTFCEEGLALAREHGSPDKVAASLAVLGLAVLEQGDTEQSRILFEESLEIRQQAGDKGGCAHSLSLLGWLNLQKGEVMQAQRYYRESLLLRQELGEKEKEGVAPVLEGLARVASLLKQTRRAARLLGAAERLRAVLGTPLAPNERALLGETLTFVRAGLDETVFTREWEEGQAMALAQVMAMAVATVFQEESQVSPSPKPSTPLISGESNRVAATKASRFGLTARELEVLQLVSLGLTDAQVAEKLVISPRTAEAHVRSFLNKLGAGSRTAAIRVAIAHQLISLDPNYKSVQES